MIRFCCLIFMMGIFIAVNPSRSTADDRVLLVVRKDFYTVEGDSASELLQSMKKRRPFNHNAYTDWHINWNYSFLIKPGKCQLTSFDVNVQVRQTLPRWEKNKKANKEFHDEWSRYINALMTHEKGHSQLGLEAATEMRTVILSQKWSDKNRAALRKKIDAQCETILKKYKTKEIEYDKTTDHGRTQGGRLRKEKRKTNEAVELSALISVCTTNAIGAT